MKVLLNIRMKKYLTIILTIISIALPDKIFAQYNIKWMTAGSLQSWFSEIGCEIEEGRIKEQQDGMQWPAIYQRQDAEAARGFWIGATNFTDADGVNYPYKVVHVGPRVPGTNEFFPQEFKMISKFDPPVVTVDGIVSYNNPTDNDEVDPTIKPDRMIVNVVNTQLGITMTRKIMQFSQQYHDNYFIYDYTFTNTGNTDGDPEIELPNNTLTGVYFYWQYRNALVNETRYEIGNATGWGINTMNDTRGDGVKVDPPNEQFRAQYSWHGHYPPFTAYDNIGAPIWTPAVNISPGDTIGRLGAPHFIGELTIHADKSATDPSDDPAQPSTTSWESSDDPLNSNNDAYNIAKMTTEYQTFISRGHKSPRHADAVQPDGNFINPAKWGDPSLGTSGGYSSANGYGPYTLAPGQSIHIIIAEAVSGISRERAIEVGKQYKQKIIDAATKNAIVMTGRDSLFQTFRRAIANYESGYNIPEPPKPPTSFTVTSRGDGISLDWTADASDPKLDHFEIYRAVGRYDSTYTLLYTAGPNERHYDDLTPVRGLLYYYYIVSVGKASDNTGVGLTPPGPLKSSRYYTQTYNPAILKRQPGTSMDQIRVVPNPFYIGAAAELTFGDQQPNRLAFFNIPGRCTIKIYTELGELIKTIEHTDGSGDAYWDSVTSSNQVVVSGLYIAVIENHDTGERKIIKFVIIR
ncbi:hypothetical protein ABRY23_01950 [Melioribacteraceae bacterium 4301-Me]|uniref:hypothetical protein n=1 Tax=Pyranulibacter aquaticus TaxID=3163344 RepID=UPI003596941E